MREYSKEEILNLENGTKVLVYIADEDWWLVCSIKIEDNEVLLKDDTIKGNGYLVGINEDYESFCKVYEYNEEDENRLVKPSDIDGDEVQENKKLENINCWTISIDWERKCVNINLNDIDKKIELEEKDFINMKDHFELLRLKQKGLF